MFEPRGRDMTSAVTGLVETPMMVIIPTGGVDRSPCGTGTTAKIATLHARGELSLGNAFVHQGATGARFTPLDLLVRRVHAGRARHVGVDTAAAKDWHDVVFTTRDGDGSA